MLCRLRRWSIFDSDAMPMFFLYQRCDVDGFGHFLPSQSVRLFLVNNQDRFFPMVFPIFGPTFSDDFVCENLKTAYFRTCSNWRQFVRIGGHHLRKYRIYKNASGGNSGILWDGLIIHTSIKHTWMLALRQASGGVYLEQLYSPTL